MKDHTIKITLPQAAEPTTCWIAPGDTIHLTHEDKVVHLDYKLVVDQEDITTPTLTITITDK